MGRYRVHEGLQPSSRTNLWFSDPRPKADPRGFLADEAEQSPYGALVNNLSAVKQVRDQRLEYDLTNDPRRGGISAPLPDMGWDAFFGRLQQKEQKAEDYGLKSRMDIAGRGPGEGIGHLASRNAEGMTEHPLDSLGNRPSLLGLRTAANTINRNAASRRR